MMKKSSLTLGIAVTTTAFAVPLSVSAKQVTKQPTLKAPKHVAQPALSRHSNSMMTHAGPVILAPKPHKAAKHPPVVAHVSRKHSPARPSTAPIVVAPIIPVASLHAPILPGREPSMEASVESAAHGHWGVTVSAENAILSGPAADATVEKQVAAGTKIRGICGEQNGFYEFVLYKTNHHAWIAASNVQLR